MRTMLDRIVTTADQLLELDEPGFRHELVAGELRRMSAAGWWHGAVVGRAHGLLAPYVEEASLGLVFGAETGFVLAREPDTVRAPDVAFVRTDRLPEAPDRGFFPGPPDLAVEVVSPSDTFSDVQEKALSWLAHGTRQVWVVDPTSKSVTVHRAGEDAAVLREGAEVGGGDVIPGFRVAVSALFEFPSRSRAGGV